MSWLIARKRTSNNINSLTRGWSRVFGLVWKPLLALVLSFFLVEILLFLGEDLFFSRGFYVFDRELGFRVRAHAQYGNAKANAFGFNDRDYPLERTPGTFRILCLADSFNWIGGPDCNYTARLERRFAEELGGSKVEVISAGYSMTHTAEQLALLRRLGLLYQPDLVVLGFYAGNDFFDAAPARKRIVYGGALTDVWVDREIFFTWLGRPVALRSRLLLLLEQSWKTWNLAQPPGPSRPTTSPPTSPNDCRGAEESNAVSLSEEAYLNSLYLRMQFVDRSQRQSWKRHERYIFDSLVEMKQLLGSRGIELLVMVFPDEVQVDAKLRRKLITTFEMDPESLEWERAQKILQEFCRPQEIEVLDLLPDFRRAHSQAPLYLLRDSHFNSAGNALAARLLLNRLIDRVRNSPQLTPIKVQAAALP